MKKEEIYVVIDSEPKRLRAIHKLRYYKEPIFSLSDIFSENPYNKCLEFYDDEWIVLGYDDKDIKKKTEISLDQLDQMLNPQFVVKDVILPIEELQKQAELLGWKLVKEERQIKVGDFGKFWTDNNCYFVGFLQDVYKISETNKCVFQMKDYGTFCYFAYLTDEEKANIQENW
jgi:hypothetical protein